MDQLWNTGYTWSIRNIFCPWNCIRGRLDTCRFGNSNKEEKLEFKIDKLNKLIRRDCTKRHSHLSLFRYACLARTEHKYRSCHLQWQSSLAIETFWTSNKSRVF